MERKSSARERRCCEAASDSFQNGNEMHALAGARRVRQAECSFQRHATLLSASIKTNGRPAIRKFLSAAQFASYWDRLRSSFWFLPSAMAAIAIALSFVLVNLDAQIGAETVSNIGWLYTFGPEGARAILSAIASSMITVAGLTFSITMLTLQLASSQFGPRLLRNFMRDGGNQLVLGTYIATFIYCLLVLRTVRGTEGSHFVPHIAVAGGVLLALASIAVLIYFIHHVANAIRIETLLEELAVETRMSIDRLYPERMGHNPASSDPRQPRPGLPPDFEHRMRPIVSDHSGYVQRVDTDALMKLAIEQDLIMRVDARPGRFVWDRHALLSAYPAPVVSDDVADRLRSAFVIGAERTPEQDLEFSVRRIIEIAQRALSPGINDPTTALYCIDRLGETFACLAERDIPAPLRVDDDGKLRVVTETTDLEQLAAPAFAAVAHYGKDDNDVCNKLLETLDALLKSMPPGSAGGLSGLREELRTKERERGCRGKQERSVVKS
jgi:uncharacterized membrane protein